jgi:hypothetical protein
MAGCGISHNSIVNAIKNSIANAKTNGEKFNKNHVVEELIKEGLSPIESNEIAKLYYSAYKSEMVTAIKKSDVIKSDKQFVKDATKVIEGVIPNPINEQNEKKIRELYDKAKVAREAGAKTDANRYELEANEFIVSLNPDVAREMSFSTFMYTSPLLTPRFAVSSYTANAIQSLNTSLRLLLNKGYMKLDFKGLKNHARLTAKDILTGNGISAMDVRESEEGSLTVRGERVEAPTKLASFRNVISRIGKKIIDTPDTLGILLNAEKWYGALSLRNKLDAGLSIKEAVAKVQEEMSLRDINEAEAEVDEYFKKIGEDVNAKGFKNSLRYRIAVEEVRRSNRDAEIADRAFLKSSKAFYKERMTKETKLGFGDTGLFGMYARIAGEMRDNLRAKAEANAKAGNLKSSSLQNALSLKLFGFLSGSSAFIERSLELIPIYGAIKIGALQYKKGSAVDKIVKEDIKDRQMEILTNNISAMLYFTGLQLIKAIAESNCEEYSKVNALPNIESKYRTTICGKAVPLLAIPPQYELAFGFYNYFLNKKEITPDMYDVLGAFTSIFQMSRWGSDAPSSKLAKLIDDASLAKQRGDEFSSSEYTAKALKVGFAIATDYATTSIGLPTPTVKNIANLVDYKGEQYDIITPVGVSIKSSPTEFFLKSTVNAAAYSLANAVGIQGANIYNENKNLPALDWQGRPIYTLQAGYFVGDGVQYNKIDNLLAQNEVSPPYLDPYKEYEIKGKSTIIYKKDALGKTKIEHKDVAYLNKEQFEAVQGAMIEYNQKWFEKHYDDYLKYQDDEEYTNKSRLQKYFKRLETQALKAVEDGKETKESVKRYLYSKMPTSKTIVESDKDFVEEE